MITVVLTLMGLAVGFAVGLKLGSKWTTENLTWRARMHFYALGLNHRAVDRRVLEVFEWPGLPSPEDYARIMRQRRAEGLTDELHRESE
jgi:hypothetical protein